MSICITFRKHSFSRYVQIIGTYSSPALRTHEIFPHVDVREHLATLWETRPVDSLGSEVAGFDFAVKFRVKTTPQDFLFITGMVQNAVCLFGSLFVFAAYSFVNF